jgi:hypothetical protein
MKPFITVIIPVHHNGEGTATTEEVLLCGNRRVSYLLGRIVKCRINTEKNGPAARRSGRSTFPPEDEQFVSGEPHSV